MKIGDLVARRWPPLEGKLTRLIGVVIERTPTINSQAFALVKWCEPHRIVEKVRVEELEVISENR